MSFSSRRKRNDAAKTGPWIGTDRTTSNALKMRMMDGFGVSRHKVLRLSVDSCAVLVGRTVPKTVARVLTRRLRRRDSRGAIGGVPVLLGGCPPVSAVGWW